MFDFRAASAASVLAALALAPAPLHAADTGAEDDTPAAGEKDQPTEGAQVYEPAYFERYSPRNALDMLNQVPGFVIDEGAAQQGARGLGQASANILVNGARFSSKSDSVRDQLSRIPAGDVVRIEIVDGTTLDIPGLSGQVANIIYKSSGSSGQFRWTTGFRPHNTQAQLYGGEVSLTGKLGKIDYTASINNENNRFGADGPVILRDGAGALVERQDTKFSGRFDNPRFATSLTVNFSPRTIAHFNMKYGRDFFNEANTELATVVGAADRDRSIANRERGPAWEYGADIAFPFGPGELKLIGLERYERDEFVSTLIDRFDDGSPDTGFRFAQDNGTGERIGRFEYGWNLLKADWQWSGEAAFNRLDRSSSLFTLDPGGNFVRLPFAAGNGGVTEDRYESILSVTAALTPKLSIQASGGVEYSKIEQTGSAANSRSFTRPKGVVSLAWKPTSDFDLALEVRRKVGQLGFGDFLASVNLDDNNSNGGNNQLQPDQSWNIELEMNKGFGAWGSAKLQVRQAWFEDFVDFFPLDNGGEARGNIGDAKRLHIEASGTIKFDPIGFKGAQINFNYVKRWMHLTDPFTGLDRGFSNDLGDRLEADFRHDIPNSDWAWGASIFSLDTVEYSRRFEVGRYWEGPSFVDTFIEHKDVFGMTARVQINNILGARDRGWRTVYDASRPDGDVLSTETQDRRIGPIFRLTLSGNF